MERRKEINDKLIQWILHKVQTEYADDVSLVVVYGSYINGTAGSKSDVDCYYIPKSEHGYDLAVDFIIEDVGYDIFPMPWERVERIADLQENMSPLVGDGRIIYSNSPKEEERFRDMQARMRKNLQNHHYVSEIAARRCEEACRLCGMLKQEQKESEIRKTAGLVIMTLADAVAVYHCDYYHFGLKKQFEDLQNNFPDIPQSIVRSYQNVVEAREPADVIKHTRNLLRDVCEYLDVTVTMQEVSEKGSTIINKTDVSGLASLYEEISSTFNKIYVCCETGNPILAFLSAVCLQRELDDAKEAGCPTYELLSGFHYKELWKLSERAEKIENDLVQFITNHGGHIKKYGSFEEFEAAGL